MSLLTLAAGILIPGAGIGGAVAKWGAKLVFGKIGGGLASAAGWLAKNPAYALAVGCLLFAALQWGEARHWRKVDAGDVTARHQAEGKFAAEQKAHAITRASLDQAKAQIADTNHRIEAVNAELERERQQWAAKDAANQKRFRSTQQEVTALEAGAKGPRTVPCKLSGRANQDLGGL